MYYGHLGEFSWEILDAWEIRNLLKDMAESSPGERLWIEYRSFDYLPRLPH